MGGMGGVGLVLVDERSRRVLVFVDVVGALVDRRGRIINQDTVRTRQHRRPREHHEIGGAARHKERIIRLQRNEHGARATLGHEIETMIEELAEESHPGIERSGDAEVRGHIRDVEDLLVVSSTEEPVEAGARNKAARALNKSRGAGGSAIDSRSRNCGRIVGRLVNDQVGDNARIGVEHEPAGLLVRRRR